MSLHFIGFRGEEYHSAVKVWGLPDFYHRNLDARALAEFFEGDVIVYAKGSENRFQKYTFDDSRIF